MTIKAVQFALAQNTATNLVPSSSFPNLIGSIQDPTPLVLKNEDAAVTIWIGGPDVSATKGQSLVAGQSIPMALYANDIPWGFTSSAANPVISVMVGLQ